MFPPEKEVGYWFLLGGVGVVAVGAIVVRISYRRTGIPEPKREIEPEP